VLGVTQASGVQSRLDGQGPALALWFHLVAAAFGIVLAIGAVLLVATVDRPRRGDDLRALRRQGLPRRFVRRAATWGNVFVVLAAAVTGLVAAAAAWLAVGNRLPVTAGDAVAVPPPRWPQFAPVGWPLLVGFASILLVSLAAALDLRRAVARGLRRG
jgi:hypothetical protein